MINYEPFFKQLVLSLIGKDKKDHQLSEGELRAAVSNAYIHAVNRAAKDSEQYLIDIPVDLYMESRYYPIVVPKEYAFIDVQSVSTNGWKYNARLDQQRLILPCCPCKDVPNAWVLKVAVTPKMTSGLCEFDEDFVERFFDPILVMIRYNLAMQDAMKWHSVGKADRLLNEYKKLIRQLRKVKGVIRMTTESLTLDSTCQPAGASCNRC